MAGRMFYGRGFLREDETEIPNGDVVHFDFDGGGSIAVYMDPCGGLRICGAGEHSPVEVRPVASDAIVVNLVRYE